MSTGDYAIVRDLASCPLPAELPDGVIVRIETWGHEHCHVMTLAGVLVRDVDIDNLTLIDAPPVDRCRCEPIGGGCVCGWFKWEVKARKAVASDGQS